MLDELRRRAASSADLRKLAGLKFRSPTKGGSSILKRALPKAYKMEGPRKLKTIVTKPKPPHLSTPKVKMSAAAATAAKATKEHPDIKLLKGGGKLVLKAGKHLGNAILNHPEKLLLVGAATIAGIGKARQAMAGFNPAIHRAKLGIEP